MKAELNIMSDRDLTIAQHVLAYSPEYADTCVAMDPSMLCDLLNSPSTVDVVENLAVASDIDFMRVVDVGTSGKRLSYSLNQIGSMASGIVVRLMAACPIPRSNGPILLDTQVSSLSQVALLFNCLQSGVC